MDWSPSAQKAHGEMCWTDRARTTAWGVFDFRPNSSVQSKSSKTVLSGIVAAKEHVAERVLAG